VIDLLFKITGHKPILSQVYQKVHRSIAALEYFTINEWTFRNQNQLMIFDEMSLVDKEIFCTDIRKIDWSTYMELYVLGVRQYLLKEKPETLPEARKRLRRLYYATQATKLLIIGGLIHQLVTNANNLRQFVQYVKRRFYRQK
jgi:fatty acyl-CoA reductase